ncbi:MAG: hypothetical protein QOJ55_1602, partial [Solirubrobacteraceae bacterium]|nr:hypothetical protein [Solirubrobacteraceae bacterium]
MTVEERGGAVHVLMVGELDISTALRLEDELHRIEAGGPQLIVLDLQ